MVPLGPANYLNNYGWEIDPNKPISGGLVFTREQTPNSEFHIFDDGRVEHFLKGVKIASLNTKKLQNYLVSYYKY